MISPPRLAALALLLVTACARRDPGPDGLRTPLWVENGTGVAFAQRHRAGQPRFDLWVDPLSGEGRKRLVRRVDEGGLHDRALRGDGRRLACVSGPSLLVCDLATGRRREVLQGDPVRPGTLAWEPSGRRLAFTMANEPAIGFVDSADNWRFSRVHSEMPVVCDWMRGTDGRLLVATDRPATQGNTLALWRAQSQDAPTVIFHVERGTIHQARSDPAGHWVAVIVRGSSPTVHSQLALLYPEQGWQRVVWESPRPLVGLRWAPDSQAVYVSQLGREEGSGWTVHRIGLSDMRPVPVLEHRAGWDLAPDGQRAVFSTGERLAITALPPAGPPTLP